MQEAVLLANVIEDIVCPVLKSTMPTIFKTNIDVYRLLTAQARIAESFFQGDPESIKKVLQLGVAPDIMTFADMKKTLVAIQNAREAKSRRIKGQDEHLTDTSWSKVFIKLVNGDFELK